MSNIQRYVDKKGSSIPHLYWSAESGIFWAVINVNGSIKRRSLKTKDYKSALNKLVEALADLGNDKAKKKATHKILKDYWDILIKEKISEEIAESTLIRIQSIWKNNIEPYFGNLRPEDIHNGMIPDYMEWHKNKFPGKQFFNSFKYLGNLFNIMHRSGAIRIEQIPKLTLPKSEIKHHDKKKGRFVTSEEFAAIVGKATVQTRLMVEIGYHLGMRKMEIGKLEKARIKAEDGRYYFELTEDDTKTGLPRIIPVPGHINVLLEAQIEKSGKSKYLFPTANGLKYLPSQLVDRGWSDAKTQARIAGRIRFHDLRHTCATNMAKAKLNPIIACTILGMSLSVYQRIYLKLTGKDLIISVDEFTQWVGEQ